MFAGPAAALVKPPQKLPSLAGDSCRMRFLVNPRPPCRTVVLRQTAQSRSRSNLQRVSSDAAVAIRRAQPDDMAAIRSSVQRERWALHPWRCTRLLRVHGEFLLVASDSA